MKLTINIWRITLTFLSAALLGAALIFAATFWLFIEWPWDWRQYFIIAIWFISSIIFYAFSVKANYYVLKDKYVLVHRYKKELAYYFGEILYIDKKYSEKHKVIKFVTNHGDVRYLTFDNKNILYKTMLERCKNVMPLDALLRRFPGLKGIR